MSMSKYQRRMQLRNPQNLDRLHALLGMLSTTRPMGSDSEQRFRAEYLHDLPGMVSDPFGNLHTVIARSDGSTAHTLWSSHTDTVHRTDAGGQLVTVDGRYFRLDKDETTSSCLGADDGVGVWIMREMILAGVPGHYVFHWGEERGGIGSGDVTQYEPERFEAIQCAIAFDRHGTRDVITRQAGEQCASNTFAQSLARQLSPVARYRPSAHGVYTDTAEYAGIVPECTNISVGYEYEHTARERVDYWHALTLLVTLCETFDERRLVIARDLAQVRRERERESKRLFDWMKIRRALDHDEREQRDSWGTDDRLIDGEILTDDWRRAALWPDWKG